MKHLRLVLVVFASALSVARAQEEERHAPPTEIPDFSNLDEYIYEPKSTVTYGFRHLSGAKTTFSGQGKVNSPEDPGAATGANLSRLYHNGSVLPDVRTAPRLDSSGNPVLDPDSGAQVFDPIAPDGKTNTWNYKDDRQLGVANGFIAFQTYAADIIDTGDRQQKAVSTAGMELAVSRDMGKLLGRITWNLTAGMSLNDISSHTSDLVRANINTITDLYSLYGQNPPVAPYSSPSSGTVNVLDPNGNPVLNADGTNQTVQTDTSILIGNQPANRTQTITLNMTNVTNTWKVKGSYFTFRAGPTVWIPITARFKASLSLGAVLVYAGTNYTVTESFIPDMGDEIKETNTSSTSRLLPGYYADATLQFDITDRAGLYAGAVFQSAGSYKQNLDAVNANYSTKIDLGNQSGLRAGLAIRF